jgi:excisionase family DNA binding protein
MKATAGAYLGVAEGQLKKLVYNGVIKKGVYRIGRKYNFDKQEIKQAWKDYAMNNRYSN